MRDEGNVLLKTLEQAKHKPHVLDNATIAHIKRVYSNQQEEVAAYHTVFTQWLCGPITQQQKEQLTVCEAILHAADNINKQVFFLIDFFKDHTIEKVIMKSDDELVSGIVSGTVFPPDGLDDKLKLVIRIESLANTILSAGGGDEELLLSLYDVMGDVKKVMDSSTHKELDLLCQQYHGFYRYMKLVEQLCEAIASGEL